MTREQDCRKEALLQLYGAGQGVTLAPVSMARVAKRSGADFSAMELNQACLFLEGQELAKRHINPGTGEQRFEITSAGVLHWENVEAN
jgi:hypothetical protein